MPIYEYECLNCGKVLSFLIIKNAELPRRCTKCGSTKLRRVMSRFGTLQSEESRLESLADPRKWGDLDENDPRSMVKFMKKMGREMGDELGEDYNDLIAEAEEEVVKSEKSKDDVDEIE